MIKDMPIIILGGSLLDSFVKVSLILILNGKSKFYNQPRFVCSTIFLGLYTFCSYMLTDNAIRSVLLFVFTNLSIWFILKFKRNLLIRILLATFFVWIVMALSDVLFGIIINTIFSISMESFRENNIIEIAGNAIILFVMCLIYLISPFRKLIIKLLTANIKKENKYIILMVFTSVLLFAISFYICQFNFNPTLILLVVFIMVIIYTTISIFTIYWVNQKNKIKTEYDILLTNLSEYENLLDRQRILNHENKNQLLVIRGMIDKNENAIEYINSLVDNQYKDSEELIMKTNRIPSGGLKGLIYYKMLIMKDKKINVSLEVSSNINRINFSNMSVKNNQELCKIIGVFLDNAIQEVENLKDKSINIIVENENGNLIIKISNNYGYSDVNHIGDNGYTTKGSGHGYGLRLVKNIIENNKKFEHKTEINGKVFSQIIVLKTKND